MSARSRLAASVSWRSSWVCGVLSALCAVVLLFSAESAHGQDKTKKAQEHFDSGAKHFVKGEYDAAILEFRKAHRLHEHPVFLYNIGLAHMRLDKCIPAIDVTREALGYDKFKGELRAKAQALVSVCTVRLGSESTVDGIERQRKRRLAEKKREREMKEQQGGADLAEPVPPPHKAGLGAIGWAGTAASVVGVGALAAAGIVTLGLQDDWETYRNTNDPGVYDQLNNDIPQKQMTGKVLLFSGIGLAATGGTMILVDMLGGSESSGSMAIVPMASPDGANVGLSVRF